MDSIKINKVLVANRGEIAVRVIKTLKNMHIDSVAIYADNDVDSLHCRMADEVCCLGSGTLKDTYLNIQKIIDIALDSGAQAIHPGYGFLSENPDFADACASNDIIFIGPDAATMRLMGNKIAARQFALDNNIPVLFGVTGSCSEILKKADSLPYPVLIKAASGGGGKGMHIVRRADDLGNELEQASREAEKYFGDGTVFVEQYIENPRHIEVQVLADCFGNIVHLHERECTIQRRYQKIIEESPSPTLTPDKRQQLFETAINICKQINYVNAGTIEFLVDEAQNFYFLEMNTRIQVEHPVTELRTGIDLVEEQIRIARHKHLSHTQDTIDANGHAIELRIYAENPAQNFLPTPGQITLYHEPQRRGVRIDSVIDSPCLLSDAYDPMIAKLICYGKNRQAAIDIARIALKDFVIQGVVTNIAYLRAILNDSDFINNNLSTNYCSRNHNLLLAAMKNEAESLSVADVVAAFLMYDFNKRYFNNTIENIWESIGYWRYQMQVLVMIEDKKFCVDIKKVNKNKISGSINQQNFEVQLIQKNNEQVKLLLNARTETAYFSDNAENQTLVTLRGVNFACSRIDQLSDNIDYARSNDSLDKNRQVSPMPGRVAKINVCEGQHVQCGQVMMVIEAMKMENNITATSKAIIKKINVKEGQMVDNKMQLLVLDYDDAN